MNPGQLLVATPALIDPNFHRTVVYLFGGDEGPAGVILNRPSDIPVATILSPWAEAAAEPAVVHFGGPVSPDHAVALGAGIHDEMVTTDIGIVDLDADTDLVASGSIRVFAGYAGWEREQLEGEIAEGSWFVVDGQPDDVLDPDPQTLWRRVLARQRGPISLYARFPEDPRLN